MYICIYIYICMYVCIYIYIDICRVPFRTLLLPDGGAPIWSNFPKARFCASARETFGPDVERCGRERRPACQSSEHLQTTTYTANLRAMILDFRGFDSSRILNSRGGIVRSIGHFPDSLSQAVLVGIVLIGRLGVFTPAGVEQPISTHNGRPPLLGSR